MRWGFWQFMPRHQLNDKPLAHVFCKMSFPYVAIERLTVSLRRVHALPSHGWEKLEPCYPDALDVLHEVEDNKHTQREKLNVLSDLDAFRVDNGELCESLVPEDEVDNLVAFLAAEYFGLGTDIVAHSEALGRTERPWQYRPDLGVVRVCGD